MKESNFYASNVKSYIAFIRPNAVAKVAKKPLDYYQFYYKSIIAGPNTKLHVSDDYLLFLSF